MFLVCLTSWLYFHNTGLSIRGGGTGTFTHLKW
jgi:hypothetical protein